VFVFFSYPLTIRARAVCSLDNNPQDMSNLPDGLAQFEFAKLQVRQLAVIHSAFCLLIRKNRSLQLLNHLNSLSDAMRKCAEISDQYAHVLHGLGPATLQVIQPMPPMGSPFAAGPPMGVNPQLNMKQMMPPPPQLSSRSCPA
jgi:hypothetical protein